MIGVYGIICLANRKLYIGQSTNVKNRWHKHRNLLRHSKHHSKGLQKAWNKYGADFFKFFIIEEANDETVHKRELYWITKLKTFNPSIGFNRNKFKEWH